VTPAVGATFAGFEIEALAGRGGMGTVYRAREPGLARPVALKVIAAEVADEPAFRARFAREARVAASIEHAHVVPVYGAGEADGCPWIAMRWVDGADLGAMIAASGRLAPALAAALVGQAASALAAAHARGLVHRDVKPANLLVGRDGHAYLTDFGLARSDAMTALTSTGGVLGTPGFASPEQVKGARVGAPTDVYALGCVLYAAIAGDQPFRREGALATAWAHVNDPVPELGRRVSGLPDGLEEIVSAALAKRPEERPAAGELAARLAAFGDGSDAARVVALATDAGDAAARAATPTPRRGDPVAPTAHDIGGEPTAGRRSSPAESSRAATARGEPSPPPTARLLGRPRRAVLALSLLVLLAIGGLAATLVLTADSGESAVTAGEPTQTPPAADPPADPVGGVVRCEGSACRQGGQLVRTLVEGSDCGLEGSWVRLDPDAATPLFACEPAERAATAPPARALDLAGARLDLAERLLDRRGVEHEASGGGAFGIVARDNWTVCATAPDAGQPLAPGEAVVLFVERSC